MSLRRLRFLPNVNFLSGPTPALMPAVRSLSFKPFGTSIGGNPGGAEIEELPDELLLALDEELDDINEDRLLELEDEELLDELEGEELSDEESELDNDDDGELKDEDKSELELGELLDGLAEKLDVEPLDDWLGWLEGWKDDGTLDTLGLRLESNFDPGLETDIGKLMLEPKDNESGFDMIPLALGALTCNALATLGSIKLGLGEVVDGADRIGITLGAEIEIALGPFWSNDCEDCVFFPPKDATSIKYFSFPASNGTTDAPNEPSVCVLDAICWYGE